MCTIAIRTELLSHRGGIPEGWPHTGDLAAWLPILFRGSVGFINERCGTYCAHRETQTARFGIHVRMKDIRRLANMIMYEAHNCVSDLRTRQKIEKQAKYYFAMNAVGLIAGERRAGASFQETMGLIREVKDDLIAVMYGNL